jgi:hypothetical protein
MQRLVSFLTLAGLTVGIALLAAPPAQARVFVGVGVGAPYYYAPYPPAVVYAPPPPVYAAPPIVYATPPASAPPASATAAAPAGQTCREFQTPAMIDGRQQMTRGTACQQPDGSWRFVN